jgi:hypothetical protein
MREKKKSSGDFVRSQAERCDVWGLGPFWESTFGGERLLGAVLVCIRFAQDMGSTCRTHSRRSHWQVLPKCTHNYGFQLNHEFISPLILFFILSFILVLFHFIFFLFAF